MLPQFTLQLLAGMSLMWLLMPRRQVTSGFFRIQMMVALGFGVLVVLSAGSLISKLGQPESDEVSAAVFWTRTETVRSLAIAISMMAYLSSICWMLEHRKAGAILAIGIWGLANLTLDGAVRGTLQPNWLGLLSAGTTASVLGGAVTSMLLGHWYLTAPAMSIQPLSRLTQILLISFVIRSIVSVVCWSSASDELHGSLLWTWWTLRWISGIVLPIGLSVMTLRILRYRNTQAATGVLFAIVILTFIGELSAALLSFELRRPF